MKKNPGKLVVVTIIILLVAILVWPSFRSVFTSGVQYITRGPAGVLSLTSTKINNSLSFWLNIKNLKKQNDELAEKITALQIDKSRIVELENENKLLKEEMGFIDDYGEVEMIPARIIERDPISFLDYIVIDRGRNDGVTEKKPVMSGGALIGRVSEVYPNSSKISLITSKDSIIQAMLQDSRSKGTLNGGVSGLLLENIIQDVEFEKGEYVVTSGLGGSLSPGLLIGRAQSVQTSGGIFKSIIVEPIADLSKIELVFVIK